jgi:hypothetical protein
MLVATVADITPKGDPVSKTFRVHLGLPDTTPLLIGMSVEANIIVQEKSDALLVPAEALVDGSLYRVQAGRVVKVPVTIGVRGTRFVEVLSGIGEADEFISPIPNDMQPGLRVSSRRAAP